LHCRPLPSEEKAEKEKAEKEKAARECPKWKQKWKQI
jgi:hypothetical protein